MASILHSFVVYKEVTFMVVTLDVTGNARRAKKTPIAAAAESRLARCGYPALKAVDCKWRNGVLVLSGRVPSYYLKQLAQEKVRGVRGVEEIVNRTEVATAEPGDPS